MAERKNATLANASVCSTLLIGDGTAHLGVGPLALLAAPVTSKTMIRSADTTTTLSPPLHLSSHLSSHQKSLMPSSTLRTEHRDQQLQCQLSQCFVTFTVSPSELALAADGRLRRTVMGAR